MPTGSHFIRLADDTVRAILRSAEPTTVVARRYALHPRYVRKLRSGIARKHIFHEVAKTG